MRDRSVGLDGLLPRLRRSRGPSPATIRSLRSTRYPACSTSSARALGEGTAAVLARAVRVDAARAWQTFSIDRPCLDRAYVLEGLVRGQPDARFEGAIDILTDEWNLRGWGVDPSALGAMAMAMPLLAACATAGQPQLASRVHAAFGTSARQARRDRRCRARIDDLWRSAVDTTRRTGRGCSTMERWGEANRAYLFGELARVRAAVEGALAGAVRAPQRPTEISVELVERAPAIVRLGHAFDLSAFERDVVLACAASELDPELARRMPAVRPSLAIMMAACPGGHVGVLAPSAPLRRHRIVEPEPGPIVAAALALDERVVHFLTGQVALDARLVPWLREPTAHPDDASPIAANIQAACVRANGSLVVGMHGGGERERQATALEVGRALGLRVYRVRGADVPTEPMARHSFRVLWERELRLQALALLVELDADAPVETIRAATTLLHDIDGLAFLSTKSPVAITRPSYLGFEIPRPVRELRLARLRRRLGERAADLDGAVEQIATQFVLGADALERACLSIDAGEGLLRDRLWNACREQARPRLDDVARRIEPMAGWDDLVVPPDTHATLEALSGHIRHRSLVYEQWGFGARANRGLGTGALFAGPSGTGKTLAAEVLAREAGLDLYHIDLSQIVNKYVGETEKNLARVFEAAEDSGAILLFDEADSLFGKRGEVEKGTDRYANLEVSYLLQRMESYRGLAILTTNQRDAVDQAFLRRLRFVISFPFPDVTLREALWRRAFPPTAPCEGLDVHRLARMQLPGGNIRNIAVNAAFLAAERGEAISMRHLLSASRAEFLKIERPFPEAEAKGWLS